MIKLVTNLYKKNILLIIDGSIAAYKAIELARTLISEHNFLIDCIITDSGKNFITNISISSLINGHLIECMFDVKDPMKHISITRNKDAIIIFPATANIISKIAHGIADTLELTTILASDKKHIIFPCMNHVMWNNKRIQHNIKLLREDGIIVQDPSVGKLACKEYGIGKSLTCDEMIEVIIKNI